MKERILNELRNSILVTAELHSGHTDVIVSGKLEALEETMTHVIVNLTGGKIYVLDFELEEAEITKDTEKESRYQIGKEGELILWIDRK